MDLDLENNIAAATAPTTANRTKLWMCKGCNVGFHTKGGLADHNEETCVLCHLTRKKKTILYDGWRDETPTIKELYNAVKILTNKVITLETELNDIKRNGGVYGGDGGGSNSSAAIFKRNLKWLNAHYIPNKSYIDWLTDVKIKRSHLDTVFDNSLVEGVIDILAEYTILPFKIFTNRKRKLFVYSQEETEHTPSWKENMTEEEFHKCVDILCGKFLCEFIKWQKENDAKIDTEESWKDKFILYTKKLMRTPAMNERIYLRVKKWLITQTPTLGGGGGGGAATAVASAISPPQPAADVYDDSAAV
jgi:hypothetical protein